MPVRSSDPFTPRNRQDVLTVCQNDVRGISLQFHGRRYALNVLTHPPAQADHDGVGGTDRSNNPSPIVGLRRHLDAREVDTIASPDRVPDRVGPPDAPSPHEPLRSFGQLPGLTDRDSSMVVLAVLLRVVGYDQLRRLLFEGRDSAAIRHRARGLEREEWLQRWNAPMPFVGRVGHLHPTARALQHVLAMVQAESAGEPWSRLIERMAPRTGRRPLDLGTAPKWFRHQREVNHLVTSILVARASDIRWASTWDCPFPQQVGGVVMPQPDYVLVERGETSPVVVFGEHDRGNEPLARFVDRKVALYSRLAGVAEEVIGIPTFRVDVSVIDVQARNPIARLRQLMEATNAYGASHLFRFTLGGWLYAFPYHPIWFIRTPDSLSVKWHDHSARLGR